MMEIRLWRKVIIARLAPGYKCYTWIGILLSTDLHIIGMIKIKRMVMVRKIVVAMINIAAGLFTAYMFIVSDRETKISKTQSNIACEIINLDLRSGSRHHPSADIIYHDKKYDTVINKSDSLQLGFNNTTFFYDEKLDRVFCRDSGINRGKYVALICFLLSFLLWLEANKDANKKKNSH